MREFGISDLALDAIGGKAKAAPSAVPGAVPLVLHAAMTHAIINPTSRFAGIRIYTYYEWIQDNPAYPMNRDNTGL